MIIPKDATPIGIAVVVAALGALTLAATTVVGA